MTFASLFGSGIAPYGLLLLVGVLPTTIWRIAGVLIGRSLDAQSPILEWVRLVSIALLAGVVGKLLGTPGGALAAVPAWGRYGGLAAGLAVFMIARRSLVAGVMAGEAVVILAAWWAGTGSG